MTEGIVFNKVSSQHQSLNVSRALQVTEQLLIKDRDHLSPLAVLLSLRVDDGETGRPYPSPRVSVLHHVRDQKDSDWLCENTRSVTRVGHVVSVYKPTLTSWLLIGWWVR